MSPRQRLSARDYKHSAKGNGGLALDYRSFAAGLGIGLLMALAVYVVDRRAQPATAAAPQPQPRSAKSGTDGGAEDRDDPSARYDFYDMLPKFEVVVPEKERDVRRDTTSTSVEQPGAYMLQVGSYRNQADAERLSGKLSKQGIDATVQRVAVDADVWHRVRIGPFRDLAKLNSVRRELRAADIDAILIRLGD